MRKFTPDSRNFGGRKVISDQYRFHYESLANARSTLKTRIQCIPKFNASVSMNKTSQGFHITKHNKLLFNEHIINIKHMNRRIQSIGTYNERKKNQFDPITHPVIFFRHKTSETDPILDQRFINKSIRPQRVNKVYRERSEKKRSNTSMEMRVEVPYIENTEKNPLVKLREDLMKVIVDNRIFKEKDIQDLFKYTREANSHLDQSLLEKAFTYTYQSLSL